MSVMAAWQNMEGSMKYFTQTYAQNSFKAFNVGSVEEIGSQFCQGFVSLKAPKSIKSILEPESPTQFYASFDSITMTTATVPATADYKVYYHIYAGKDAGVYYSVYLKNPPQTSYYASTSTIYVSSGFINQGDYKSETKDFTAPQGYKELCVRINDEEKCGFKSVTTDFGMNYLSDSYAKNELTTGGITSEKECVSGSANLGAATGTLNVQTAVESATMPEIYNRGIIRICSKDDPGKSTDATRYKDVGYCGNTGVRCWLDTNSVQNAITDSNIGAKTEIADTLDKEIQKAKNDVIYLENEGNEKINKIESDISIDKSFANKNTIFAEIENTYAGLTLNNQKAQLLLIKAKYMEAIVMNMLPNLKVGSAAATTAVPATQPTVQPSESVTSVVFTDSSDIKITAIEPNKIIKVKTENNCKNYVKITILNKEDNDVVSSKVIDVKNPSDLSNTLSAGNYRAIAVCTSDSKGNNIISGSEGTSETLSVAVKILA